MTNFYTNATQWGNSLLVREVVDGEGERRSVSFNIEYATKDQVEANHMIGQGVTLND